MPLFLPLLIQFVIFRTLSAESLDLLDHLREIQAADFCGERVPLEDPEVREMFEREFLLLLWDRPQVILYLKRMGRYFPLFERSFKPKGLPEDLKYLAIVESALRPEVGSPKGAVGIWQFIESTGRKYGLEINESIDERRSPHKSTEAAARYLLFLRDTLGSWTLAAAAYNMGEKGLFEEIARQGTTDFYRLYLPLETRRYLFKIVAAKLILSHPIRYGFLIFPEETYSEPETAQVTIHPKKSLPVRWIADAAGTDYKRIRDLNPEIRKPELPPGRRTLLIPPMNRAVFQTRLDSLIRAREGGGDAIPSGRDTAR